MNDYNELAVTAQIKSFDEVVTYPGANNSTHRRTNVDLIVPRERPIGEKYEFDIVTMQILNKKIDQVTESQLKPGDWVICEFQIRTRESNGKKFTNVNVVKLSKTKV